MMFLSGVWFSLEGAPAWLQQLAARLPLSQIIEAARAVMLEGAGWQEVAGPLGQVMVFALVCISLGAMLFKWSANETCSVVVAGGGLACAGRYPALQERLADRGRHHGRAAGSLRPADAQEDLTRFEENGFGARVTVKYAERWTYNFGKREFMQFVTVENGVITDIADGPRGG
jgi:hypothetical protein